MKKLLKSFSYAGLGIVHAFKQRNFKIQLAIAVVVMISGAYFRITETEWCIILLCTGLVLSLEMMNSAIEHLVDLVSPDYNKTAGIAKDIAAGSVLFFSIISAIIGAIIFSKYFINLF